MRRGPDLLDAWVFTQGIDIHSAQRVAGESGACGDTQVAILTAGPRWLRVELVDGASAKPGAMLFVAGRGLFEVTRRDEWDRASGGKRVLLTLRTPAGA